MGGKFLPTTSGWGVMGYPCSIEVKGVWGKLTFGSITHGEKNTGLSRGDRVGGDRRWGGAVAEVKFTRIKKRWE